MAYDEPLGASAAFSLGSVGRARPHRFGCAKGAALAPVLTPLLTFLVSGQGRLTTLVLCLFAIWLTVRDRPATVTLKQHRLRSAAMLLIAVGVVAGLAAYFGVAGSGVERQSGTSVQFERVQLLEGIPFIAEKPVAVRGRVIELIVVKKRPELRMAVFIEPVGMPPSIEVEDVVWKATVQSRFLKDLVAGNDDIQRGT